MVLLSSAVMFQKIYFMSCYNISWISGKTPRSNGVEKAKGELFHVLMVLRWWFYESEKLFEFESLRNSLKI